MNGASRPSASSDAITLALSLAGIAIVTVVFQSWLHLTSPTMAALSYLLIVLIASAIARLRVALAASMAADLCLNYFFMPPFGTFRIDDPQNWVALSAFLAVSIIASSLSTAARDRAREAMARRDELARLLHERTELLEARRTAELARQSEELKSALLASLSHNLRTPLTAIRVAASNLQAPWLADADRREQSDLILAEVERLGRLFQNILEMARIDAGAIAPEVQWVDPAEIFEAASESVQHTLRQREVALTADADHLVLVDPRLTSSALAHVLENAAQYTPAGSPIAVGMRVSEDALEITVRDRGPGIAESDLPQLFERFYRGPDVRRRVSGTGMGLSIARGLLNSEGGTISAENCSDGGARFTMIIPARQRVRATADRT
jgi:two-component system sensor histidine kinase KdpD